MDDIYGVDLFGESLKPKPAGVVAQRFEFPPFTVFDARGGDWRERKRAWISIGIKGESGRNALAGGNGTSKNSCYIVKDGSGKSATSGDLHGAPDANCSSIFDPSLCEIMIRWFSPAGGQIVDPFAGGSVRGIVAGSLGRNYWGCDLRPEQIAANEEQAREIQPEKMPQWVCGDSMEKLDGAPDADFVFSCPPYGDLEKYSDHPADLSGMEWHAFVAAYKRIILRSVKKLKPNSFACFVVGDFRCSKGFYRDFVSTTIRAFEECGARLYNEAILVTSVGSAAMRVSKQFAAGRKLAKTHQNVLVFCKGDWKEAARKCNGNSA